MLYINGNVSGYSEDQCGYTLTVGELIEILNRYDDMERVYIMNDGGYTYGSITEEDISTDKKELGYRYYK